MSDTCPACGAAASGRFCDQCGAAIAAACAECGNPLPRGARFCNMCGAAAGATATAQAVAAKPSPLPWVVATIAVLALAAVLLVPRLSRDEVAEAPAAPGSTGGGPFAAAPQGPASGGDPRAVDLSQMTPREAADRLFNRVMTAISSGDSAQARQFQPMAVMAYQRVEQLDADGRYHLAALQLVGGDFAAARAEADSILASNPTHLFGLFTAGEAEARRGNQTAARDFYNRFLQAYDAEMAKGLAEYQEHAQGLPAMREQARQVVGAAN